MKVLLVGVVTREMAQSAVAAGYEVISLDYFGDSDQPASAEVFSLTRDFSYEPDLRNLAAAAKTLTGRVDRIVVGAGLENEPALWEIGRSDIYWTNSAISVQKVRDPRLLAELLGGTGMQFPRTILPGGQLPSQGAWLVKDGRHSGGLGVREWDGKTPLEENEILQEKIDGRLMSACFLANGRQSRLIGISYQYAGVPELGAPPFAWCGNVAPCRDPGLEDLIACTAQMMTGENGLAGVNGMDFILQDSVPYLLEINPRWMGSMELFERLYGVNMFQLHVEACQGRLPEGLPSMENGRVLGKGILYAEQDTMMGDTTGWKEFGIADIPHSSEKIPAGAPVCTVFSEGKDGNLCWKEVVKKAQALMRK